VGISPQYHQRKLTEQILVYAHANFAKRLLLVAFAASWMLSPAFSNLLTGFSSTVFVDFLACLLCWPSCFWQPDSAAINALMARAVQTVFPFSSFVSPMAGKFIFPKLAEFAKQKLWLKLCIKVEVTLNSVICHHILSFRNAYLHLCRILCVTIGFFCFSGYFLPSTLT